MRKFEIKATQEGPGRVRVTIDAGDAPALAIIKDLFNMKHIEEVSERHAQRHSDPGLLFMFAQFSIGIEKLQLDNPRPIGPIHGRGRVRPMSEALLRSMFPGAHIEMINLDGLGAEAAVSPNLSADGVIDAWFSKMEQGQEADTRLGDLLKGKPMKEQMRLVGRIVTKLESKLGDASIPENKRREIQEVVNIFRMLEMISTMSGGLPEPDASKDGGMDNFHKRHG